MPVSSRGSVLMSCSDLQAGVKLVKSAHAMRTCLPLPHP